MDFLMINHFYISSESFEKHYDDSKNYILEVLNAKQPKIFNDILEKTTKFSKNCYPEGLYLSMPTLVAEFCRIIIKTQKQDSKLEVEIGHIQVKLNFLHIEQAKEAALKFAVKGFQKALEQSFHIIVRSLKDTNVSENQLLLNYLFMKQNQIFFEENKQDLKDKILNNLWILTQSNQLLFKNNDILPKKENCHIYFDSDIKEFIFNTTIVYFNDNNISLGVLETEFLTMISELNNTNITSNIFIINNTIDEEMSLMIADKDYRSLTLNNEKLVYKKYFNYRNVFFNISTMDNFLKFAFSRKNNLMEK